MIHLRLSLLLLLCGSLAACAGRPILPAYLPDDASAVELTDTPFFPQERYQCGPAALATVLNAAGVPVRPEALVSQVYIPELEGSLQAEMLAATRSHARVPYVLPPNLPALLAELQAGRPVLVLENLGWRFYPVWHYAVVIGYRPAEDRLILRSGKQRRLLVATDDFLDDWGKAEHWAMLALKPGRLPVADDSGRYLQAVAGLEEAGEIAAAEAAYRAAVRRWPQTSAAWFGLGNARYALGDHRGAERAYRAALERQPQAPAVRNNLAQVLAERGCPAAARRQLERAMAQAPASLHSALEQTLSGLAAYSSDTAAQCPAD